MGAFAFVNRALDGLLGLTVVELKNLSSLYLATFIMRAAAFAGVAVMQHSLYPDPVDAFWKGLLFAVFPLAEIASVGYFGTLCDRTGRKKVLVFAHIITAVAVFLFIPSISPLVPGSVTPYLVAVFFAMFGIGAAAKVSSTLTMVNDLSSLRNRAQLMAVFDLVTLGGFGAGFGAGFLALTVFGLDAATVLLVAGGGVLFSVVMVILLVRDTQFLPEVQSRTWDLLRSVLRDRDILRLLPVYVPVIALYGYVISFADQLLVGSKQEPLRTGPTLVLVTALVIPLIASMVASGRVSDRAHLRRPFMAVGLLCFGGLAILLASASRPDGGIDPLTLYPRWPLLALLAVGAGAFPPAALAYLGDIVQKTVSGTAFGLYSIVFGSGLIIGPIMGGALTVALGSLAFIITALSLIGISAVTVFFIREPARGTVGAPRAEALEVAPLERPP